MGLTGSMDKLEHRLPKNYQSVSITYFRMDVEAVLRTKNQKSFFFVIYNLHPPTFLVCFTVAEIKKLEHHSSNHCATKVKKDSYHLNQYIMNDKFKIKILIVSLKRRFFFRIIFPSDHFDHSDWVPNRAKI